MAAVIGSKAMPYANMLKPVIGVVLAGGQSSRMGQNKALMRYKGITLLEHAVQLLQLCGVEKVLVSGQYEGYSCIPDLNKGLGPLGGIISVVDSSKLKVKDNVRFLFLPIDMPLLTHQILLPLLQSSLVDVVAYQDYPLPMMLEKSERVLEVLTNIIQVSDKKSRSLKCFMSQLKHEYLSVCPESQGQFKNINTMDEWRGLNSFVQKEA